MKCIPTNHAYQKDGPLWFIYNQDISEQFPGLFAAYWKVYETHSENRISVERGESTFLYHEEAEYKGLKHERFGNYLYGSLLSLYFSWELLNQLKSIPTIKNTQDDLNRILFIVRKIQDDLDRILLIDGIVRHLFTSLDALSCCVYIAENSEQENDKLMKELGKCSFKTVHFRNYPNHPQIVDLCERDDFKYLSKYRNLLTHRPFYQFDIDDKDRYFLPNDLSKLDSLTQKEKDYMKQDVTSYISSAFAVIVDGIENILLVLDTRYREKMQSP